MSKIAIFFRKYGHKILTFTIGLVFLAGCVGLLALGVNRVYHMFKPAHIYEEGWSSEQLWGGAPFYEVRESGLEEGSAEYFQLYIANFIRQDFPSFTNVLELKTDYFVSYGIWQAIKMNGQGVYARNENGGFLIPKADVEKFARYNFDYAGQIPNGSVEVNGAFTYDRLSGCYKVDANEDVPYLVPKVLEVKWDEATGVYTLLVDCYLNDALNEEDVTADPTKFSKRLSITLQQTEQTVETEEGESTVTNYLYTSCALVDETIGNKNTDK